MWHLSESGWGWVADAGGVAGSAGGGQGHQADRIAARFQLVHLATGDLLLFSVAAVGTVDEVSERILHAPRDLT